MSDNQEFNLYDSEHPRRQTVSDSSSVFNNENTTEWFIYDVFAKYCGITDYVKINNADSIFTFDVRPT